MKHKRPSIEARILKLLQRGRSITPIQALTQFGCLRLSARIHTLRKDGHMIAATNHKTETGKTVAKYKLLA